MRAILRHRFFGLLLTLMLVVSAAGVQAHRAPLTPDDVALQAHAQFWGEAQPALCAAAGESEVAGPGRCDACRLLAAASLPDPALPLLLRGQPMPQARALPAPLRRTAAPRPANAARAPPRG